MPTDNRSPDQRTPVDHLCVVCCKRTYENVGIQINGTWYCFTCGSKKRDGEPIQPTSNSENIKPPYDVALPKITAEIWESYQDEEFIEDSPRWEWTQAAVDFACEIVRPAVRADIERLTRENAELRHDIERHVATCAEQATELERLTRELADEERVCQAWGADRDRVRAALKRFMAHPNVTLCGCGEPGCTTRQALEALFGELPQPPYTVTRTDDGLFLERGSDETTASPQAPVVLLTVSQAGEIAGVTMYAPGLPPGEHDLYCEPEAVAPMMRSAEKANECKPGFTQACSSFGDDPDAPGCCSYCGQPREAHPQKGPV